MTMFMALVHYEVQRRIRVRRTVSARLESGHVKLVIQADDLASARRKARAWFESESTSRAAHITFGTGIRDAVGPAALAADKGDDAIYVVELDGDVAVMS